MIIGNFDIERVPSFPAKAHSVLIVNTNTVLSSSLSLERLKTVRRRRRKVANLFRGIDLGKTPERDRGDLLESSDAAALENRFCVFVAKRADQTFRIARIALYAERRRRFPKARL
jgi:hypothetical protein